jgi:hypothetical protein
MSKDKDFFIKHSGVEQVFHIPRNYIQGVASGGWYSHCGRWFLRLGTNIVKEVRPEAVCDLCKAAVARGD